MPGTELVEQESVSEALARPPIYYDVDAQKLALLQETVAKKATPPEISMFLELARRYDLDPFAKEIWCAVSDKGNRQVLIMAGRDGLRKIAARNGLDVDGDVVRKNDTFKVSRNSKRERVVEHEYAGGSEARGPIIGAWAECWEKDTGKQRGYFFAPMHEYRPTSEAKLKFSPWGSQESVMILAAAERQATRQATPLGGLIAEGEMDLNMERMEAPVDEVPMIREMIESLDTTPQIKVRLNAAVESALAAAPGSISLGKAQMLLLGRDSKGLIEQADAWERQTVEILSRQPAPAETPQSEEEPPDAEVVPDGPEEAATGAVEVDLGQEVQQDAETLRLRLGALLDRRSAAEADSVPEKELSELDAQIDELQQQLDSLPADEPEDGKEATE